MKKTYKIELTTEQAAKNMVTAISLKTSQNPTFKKISNKKLNDLFGPGSNLFVIEVELTPMNIIHATNFYFQNFTSGDMDYEIFDITDITKTEPQIKWQEHPPASQQQMFLWTVKTWILLIQKFGWETGRETFRELPFSMMNCGLAGASNYLGEFIKSKGNTLFSEFFEDGDFTEKDLKQLSATENFMGTFLNPETNKWEDVNFKRVLELIEVLEQDVDSLASSNFDYMKATYENILF